MTEPSRYAVDLDALEAAARVPRERQVEEQDETRAVGPDDDATGHLPGGVRPYGA